MIKRIVGVGAIALCMVVCVAWILGDDFGPFVGSMKTQARRQFKDLVDEYEFELEKAKKAGAQAKERAAQLRAAQAKAKAKVHSLERTIELAQHEITGAQGELASLEQRLTHDGAIRLVSGRLATPGELKVIVEGKKTRIELADEKIRHLQGFLGKRRTMLAKLEQASREAPVALARLHTSIDVLSQKVEMYRDMKALADEEQDAEEAFDSLFASAQRTLEEAHAKVDGKLFELEAMLEVDLELAPADAQGNVTVDEVLADIRSTLGKGVPAFADN